MALDKAPFDGHGNMKTWVRGRYRHESQDEYDAHTVWRDNVPFEATMELTGFGRGMSSARFHWQDHEGHRYEMFMKEMGDLILATTLERGVVHGKWIICKRGQNYGLKFVE